MAQYIDLPVVGGGGGGSGTVTSVGLSAAPSSVFNVSGSPVTTTGTLALSMDNQSANVVLAGPTSGGAAAPAFRALVAADIPSLSYVTSVAMTVPSILSVAGSPITSSGTLAVTLATQSANLVWAGPTNGAAAAPTFRSLVAADIPNITNASANVLTGYTSGAGTVAATDTILQAIQKLNGNIAAITSGVTTMAAVGASPNANGATISGSTLTLQPADATNPGVVTASGTQIWGGTKQFGTTKYTYIGAAFGETGILFHNTVATDYGFYAYSDGGLYGVDSGYGDAIKFNFRANGDRITLLGSTAHIIPASTSNLGNSATRFNSIFLKGDVVLSAAALATGATAGFTWIPTCAGTPSGTPTSYTGTVAMVYDTNNNLLYVYNGAWKASPTFV